MKRILPLCITVLCVLFPGMAHAWPAKMMDVIDGDTIMVAPAGDTSTPTVVRLYGIDAPEIGQAYGEESAAWLKARLPKGRKVEIVHYDMDKYGRVVAVVYIKGKAVNTEMVSGGLAWVYPQYCRAKFCRAWKENEKLARKEESGLWAGDEEDTVEPWVWREKNRKEENREAKKEKTAGQKAGRKK